MQNVESVSADHTCSSTHLEPRQKSQKGSPQHLSSEGWKLGRLQGVGHSTQPQQLQIWGLGKDRLRGRNRTSQQHLTCATTNLTPHITERRSAYCSLTHLTYTPTLSRKHMLPCLTGTAQRTRCSFRYFPRVFAPYSAAAVDRFLSVSRLRTEAWRRPRVILGGTAVARRTYIWTGVHQESGRADNSRCFATMTGLTAGLSANKRHKVTVVGSGNW